MTSTAVEEDPIRRKARRGLLVYFIIVLILSVALEGYIISHPQRDGLIAALMLVPALASVVARLLLKEGFFETVPSRVW